MIIRLSPYGYAAAFCYTPSFGFASGNPRLNSPNLSEEKESLCGIDVMRPLFKTLDYYGFNLCSFFFTESFLEDFPSSELLSLSVVNLPPS